MTEDLFDERIINAEPVDDLSFEYMAELEALALSKNWNSSFDTCVDQFNGLLSEDTHAIVDTLDLQSEVDGRLQRIFSETSEQLDKHVNDTIREAVIRRGETPTP